MTRLIVMRHGEYHMNYNEDLTEKGVVRVTKTAEKIRRIVGDENLVVYCSDQMRAINTAKLVLRTLGVGAEPIKDYRLYGGHRSLDNFLDEVVNRVEGYVLLITHVDQCGYLMGRGSDDLANGCAILFEDIRTIHDYRVI